MKIRTALWLKPESNSCCKWLLLDFGSAYTARDLVLVYFIYIIFLFTYEIKKIKEWHAWLIPVIFREDTEA